MRSVSVKFFLNILLFQLVMLFCFSFFIFFFAFKNYDDHDHVMSWVYRIIPNEKVEYNNIFEYITIKHRSHFYLRQRQIGSLFLFVFLQFNTSKLSVSLKVPWYKTAEFRCLMLLL